MASVKLLLSQARRHYLTKTPSHFHSPLSLTSNRSLSSESDPPRRPSFEPIPIQPVSYPVKPKDPSPPESQPSSSSSDDPSLNQPPPSDAPEQRRAWTREDIRYVKDGPSVSPVAYPTRVAPLPEDKDGNEELEKERMKIEAEDQLRKRIAKAAEEEKMKVPFPLLIKPNKNEKPPVYDLAEAIRQVKVRYY